MKRLFTSAIIAFCLVFSSSACRGANPEPVKDLVGKKALVVIASSNFQDKEFSAVRDKLSARGALIKVASSKTEECEAMNKSVKVKPDILLKDAKADDYDAVIFIGGPGVSEYYDSAEAHALAKAAVEKKKVLAAICLAPNVLAKAGLLKDKNAACYGDKQMLTDGGAKVSEEHVVTDGKIVTADGPDAAGDFADAVAKVLLEKQSEGTEK